MKVPYKIQCQTLDLFAATSPVTNFHMQTGKSKTQKRKPVNPVLANLPKTPAERIFKEIGDYITFSGAEGPSTATNFLIHEFISDNKTPLKKWDNEFVSDLIWEVNRLNRFLSQLEVLYRHKVDFDRFEQIRQNQILESVMATVGGIKAKRGK